MPDSNEIVTNQQHARLRLPQAGIKAQKEYDEGRPLTSESYANRMNDLMLDLLNGRVEQSEAIAAVQIGNSILKAAELELKSREIYYKYQQNTKTPLVEPHPLQLAGKTKKAAG